MIRYAMTKRRYNLIRMFDASVSVMRWVGLCLLCAAALTVRPLWAQMDLEDEIRSLSGHDDFGLVIDIESNLPDGFVGLDNSVWRERLTERLRQLVGHAPSADVDPTIDPHLYIHVNAMSVDGNLIPFAIDASFLQMARIGRGNRMMAVTWESGLVGLVSRGETPQIIAAGVGIVEEFVSDLKQSMLLE